jgi:hypothetical protein
MSTPPRIRLTLEPLEDRVLPSAPPLLQMTFATTTDHQTISVNYNISGADLTGQTLNFNVYRSAGYNSLNGAQLIGTAALPALDSGDLSVGSHPGVKLSLTGTNGQALTALTPNPALPFLVVVANPGGTIQEAAGSNNTASFETHVLGVIVHGLEFDLLSLLENLPPAWETQMAAALQQTDGYEAVIPFDWSLLSILPVPYAIDLAANMLVPQVIAKADQLAGQHPGDVVDINFIGHSRGTSVVGQTLQDLAGTSDPALRGGYLQMTLLDPHPANNLYGQFNWAFFIPEADSFAELVILFQALTRDPQVVVPSNVAQVQLFDEQTPAGQLFSDPTEFFLNLWGDPPAEIRNDSAQPIQERNLTNTTASGIGLIGHTEVHDWYLANVVDRKDTFTNFA